MTSLTPKDVFLTSLERCAASDEFLTTFYGRFLATSDEIRDKFRHTNFEQQERMLMRSLKLLSAVTSGDPAALSELTARAESHNRYHLNVKPSHYELWRSALIETASEFDPYWDSDIADAWHRILGHIINHMVRNY